MCDGVFDKSGEPAILLHIPPRQLSLKRAQAHDRVGDFINQRLPEICVLTLHLRAAVGY